MTKRRRFIYGNKSMMTYDITDERRDDCEGCTECLTAKCDLCSTPTKPGESICWDCAESVARDA